ncbi:MAG: hypothetical protein AB1593_11920 [Pseudomonadota bacterium]
MGKAPGLALLALGLALGPGLWIAARYFSGQVGFEAPLRFLAGADGRRAAQVVFPLTDTALPASVIVQAFASHGPALLPADPPGDTWTLRLRRDGRIVREHAMQLQSHTIEATPGLVFKDALVIDAAAGSGDYTLDVALPAAPKLTLESASVQIRTGVREPSTLLLAAGLALAAMGGLLLFAVR